MVCERTSGVEGEPNLILYYPYVEPVPEAGKGLIVARASDSCPVFTDAFPEFSLPRMGENTARKVRVREYLKVFAPRGLSHP